MSRKLTVAILLFLWCLPKWALAEPTATQFARSVVGIYASIEPTGRTVEVLGVERSGSGVVVDSTGLIVTCLLYTSPSPRDGLLSRMPSSA